MKAVKKAFKKEKQNQAYLKEYYKRCDGVYEDNKTSYSVLNEKHYLEKAESECEFLNI